MSNDELKGLLDTKADEYERPAFVDDDPISVPHLYERKEDIEIAGLLAATISWGNRKAIVKKAHEMMTYLDNAPYEFVMGSTEADEARLSRYVYRTFQSDDLCGMVRALKHIYTHEGGMERVFALEQDETVFDAIVRFRSIVVPHLSQRTLKHVADPARGSAAKRINMFLRWMVRPSGGGVDFGLWKSISAADLVLPLDVHTGNVSRALGLTTRKQSDRKTVDDIMTKLRQMNPQDPVRYDFALFGLGMFDKLTVENQ